MDQQTLSHYLDPALPRCTASILDGAAVFAVVEGEPRAGDRNPLGECDLSWRSLGRDVAHPARPPVFKASLRDEVIEAPIVDGSVGRA